MISVIIPLYNKEDYILETLQSVLTQTYKEFELIIVNDGSTDNSLEIVKNITDKRIKIIDILNSGVCIARNTGVQNAKYNWIAFLDADDWWDKTFLHEIVLAINNYPNEKIFASGRSRVFRKVVERYQNTFLPNEDETAIVDYIKVISRFLPPINSSNVVIDKQAIIKADFFNVNQKKHEDHDLWLRLCSQNQVVLVNKNLSFYRKEVISSASQGLYSASDLISYMTTIKNVKEKIDSERLLYFKKYYNKFILLTFIKYEAKYTNIEIEKLLKIAITICDGYYLWVLKIITFLPSGLTYKVLKKIK